MSNCRHIRINTRCALSIVLVAALFVGAADRARAQQTPWSWSAWTSGSLAMPSSDVREFPEAPSCLADTARLDDRSGYALAVGGGVARSIARDLHVGARAGVAFSSTRFAARERIGRASDANGAVSDVIVEYRSDVDIVSLALEPVVQWRPTSPLMLSAGVLVSVPVSAVLDHREVLVAPSQATYGEGGTERALASGSLSQHARTWLGISASAGFDVELARRVWLRPEIGGVFALGSPLRNVSWRPHELRLGLTLVFGELGESTPIVPYER